VAYYPPARYRTVVSMAKLDEDKASFKSDMKADNAGYVVPGSLAKSVPRTNLGVLDVRGSHSAERIFSDHPCNDMTVTSVEPLSVIFGLSPDDDPGCSCDIIYKNAWDAIDVQIGELGTAPAAVARDKASAWQNVFDKNAKVYGKETDLHVISGFEYLSLEQWHSFVCNLSLPLQGKIKSGQKVMEFGMGTGAFIDVLPACFNGVEYIEKFGLDFSSASIATATQRVRGTFFAADATDAHMFEDRMFDHVYSNSMFEYLGTESKALAALKEMVRVLKPGGTLTLFDVSDLSRKDEAMQLRKTHRKGQANLSATPPPEHLYLSMRFIEIAAHLLGVRVLNMKEERNLPIVAYYPPARYRTVVSMAKLNEDTASFKSDMKADNAGICAVPFPPTANYMALVHKQRALQRDPAWTCPTHSFSHIDTTDPTEPRLIMECSHIGNTGFYGHARDPSTPYTEPVILSTLKEDWVYTTCGADRLLHFHPRPMEMKSSPEDPQHNFLFLQLDALSRASSRALYPTTMALLSRRDAFVSAKHVEFLRHQVYGFNSKPNMRRIYCGADDCDDQEKNAYAQFKGNNFNLFCMEDAKTPHYPEMHQHYCDRYPDAPTLPNNQDAKNPGCNEGQRSSEHMLGYLNSSLAMSAAQNGGVPRRVAALFNFLEAHNTVGTYATMDEKFRETLLAWDANGVLASSVIFLYGDHGFHFNGIGQNWPDVFDEYEHRFPALHVIIGNNVVGAVDMVNMAQKNKHRLIGHLDLHSTMLAFAKRSHRKSELPKVSGTYNLLRDNIPACRSCEDVGHGGFCGCLLPK